MKTKTIQKEIGTGTQSCMFTHVLEAAGRRLRVRIVSDAYQQQCTATIDLWRGDEWTRVASLHPSQMKTIKGLCYGPRDVTVRDFEADQTELLRIAAALLAN